MCARSALYGVAEQCTSPSDGCDPWHAGRSVEELERGAHIDPESFWQGIARFAAERAQRLPRMRV